MSALVSELPFGVTTLNVSNADKAATEIRHVQIVGTMKSGTMPLASIYCLTSRPRNKPCSVTSVVDQPLAAPPRISVCSVSPIIHIRFGPDLSSFVAAGNLQNEPVGVFAVHEHLFYPARTI